MNSVDQAEDRGDDVGQSKPDPFESVLSTLRRVLKPGGPEVDYRMLHLYVDSEYGLPDDVRIEVTARIATWKNWFQAYWRLRLELDDTRA